MVMAPGGNLGGDTPNYPQYTPQTYRINKSGTQALSSAGLVTVLTSPVLPPGWYFVAAQINASDVTATDSMLAVITPTSVLGGQLSGSVKVPVSGNASLMLCGIVQVTTANNVILLRAQSGATANLTVNGLDPDTGNFQATWMQITPLQ